VPGPRIQEDGEELKEAGEEELEAEKENTHLWLPVALQVYPGEWIAERIA
jgi:hypothetical protein